MLRTIRKENAELARVLIELRKAAKAHEAPVWYAVAEKLARPRRKAKPVNVGHLERLADAKETLVVPGKVLAHGSLTKPLTVAAFHYSEDARTKIHAAGGKALSIGELLKAQPKGTGVRLFA
ncbi:MAG TPA: 50S ribosomal protein L18e [Thermoplasmata archaeon]|jgi:large subunit ribosomal protein L18e|nr:50S ribosomal protein L18e [Thermoplasmata archaeon]